MLNPRPDWSPLGVKFKISDEHPRLFHMGVPLPGLLHCEKYQYLLYSLETIRLDGKPSVVLDFLLIPDSSSSLQLFFLFNKFIE